MDESCVAFSRASFGILSCLCMAGLTAGVAFQSAADSSGASVPAKSESDDPLLILKMGDWKATLNSMLDQYQASNGQSLAPLTMDREGCRQRLNSPDLRLVAKGQGQRAAFTYVGGETDFGKEVLMYSDLYTVMIRDFKSLPKTPEGRYALHGFYLVVYRSGEWEKVPVGKVRVKKIPIKKGEGILDLRFPKMDSYQGEGTEPLYRADTVDPMWR
jgi:hypothetical protein